MVNSDEPFRNREFYVFRIKNMVIGDRIYDGWLIVYGNECMSALYPGHFGAEIVEDEEYDLEIMLDSELWEATAVGVVYDGYPGVEVSTDNWEFLEGLAYKNVLSFLDDEGHPYSFSLAGTAVALESTWDCIESML